MNMKASALSVILSLVLPMAALAQEPGENGPVASMGPEVAQVSPPQGVVSDTATRPVATQAPASAPETSKRPPRVRSSAPPAAITVQSGRNTTFSVALFHANRIVIPFRNPEVRTSSTSLITVEDGVLYVTTQTEDPIGLFVFDKSDPAEAISLTLMPQAIAPVSVTISLQGWVPPQHDFSVQANPATARGFETEDPYVAMLKTLFKELASERVPEGYGLSGLTERYPFMPACSIPGTHIVPVQLVEGVEVTAIVARVTNTSYQQIEVNESACVSDRMLGAATWPTSTLGPGESAELYLAIKSPLPNEGRKERPSVVRGRIR